MTDARPPTGRYPVAPQRPFVNTRQQHPRGADNEIPDLAHSGRPDRHGSSRGDRHQRRYGLGRRRRHHRLPPDTCVAGLRPPPSAAGRTTRPRRCACRWSPARWSSNTHQSTNGAGGNGDGFIRTAVGSVAGVLSSTTATWSSPTFTYNGAGGEVPDTVSFTMDRRVDAGALLALLSGAHYEVVLDKAGGATGDLDAQVRCHHRPAGVEVAHRCPRDDPASLTIGADYRFRIATELDYVVGVLPGGTFDYDNVLLRASKVDADRHRQRRHPGRVGQLPDGRERRSGRPGRRRRRRCLRRHAGWPRHRR